MVKMSWQLKYSHLLLIGHQRDFKIPPKGEGEILNLLFKSLRPAKYMATKAVGDVILDG